MINQRLLLLSRSGSDLYLFFFCDEGVGIGKGTFDEVDHLNPKRSNSIISFIHYFVLKTTDQTSTTMLIYDLKENLRLGFSH
jgi:hypothetical protein